MTRARLPHPVRRAALVAAASLAAAGAASAAVVGAGDAPRARLQPAGDAPLFGTHNAADLRPGSRRTACTSVVNAGDAPGRAALYAAGVAGALAPHLTLTVERGPAGGACGSFTARGVAYRGRLSDFPARIGDALIDPEPWQPGARHAYRFTLELGDDPAAAGLSARWDWRLAVDTIAAAHAPSRAAAPAPCGAVALAGTARGRTRTVTKTVRLSRRVRAVLRLRTSAAAGAPRVVVTTGLRVRGKTLLIERWARVRYRLNGTRTRPVRRRPFRARLAAASFRPGRNRVSVAVQRRRGGPKRVAAFRVDVQRAVVAGREVCVVSA